MLAWLMPSFYVHFWYELPECYPGGGDVIFQPFCYVQL